MCDFTYKHYIEIFERAKMEGYKISRLCDYVLGIESDKQILLRHDIDLSVSKAYKLAKVEEKIGVTSTYFVRIRGLYNVYESKNLKRLSKIVDMGHEIGLHWDVETNFNENRSLVDSIIKDKKILEQLLDIKICGFSSHSPKRIKELYGINISEILTHPKIKDNFMYHASSPIFMENFQYISDSNRYWRDGCICRFIGKDKKLYALIHPIWWAEESLSVISIIEEVIRGDML